MLKKFICLANSFKEGGRCIAGIEVDSNNNAVFVNSRPKWIRPVCGTLHGEIPNQIAEPFQILDILELDVIDTRPNGYQSENVIFNESSIRVVGNINRNQLANLCDDFNHIFRNRGKAVSKEKIGELNHSLVLVSVNEFEAVQHLYSDRDKPQTRLVFTYHGNSYDFPITDPRFLQHYKQNKEVLKNIGQVYLCLSLGIEWEGWYYKLVACII